MFKGFGGRAYTEVADSLIGSDPYMVLVDFDDYARAQAYSAEVYTQRQKWARMALLNTASSGIFSADRAIRDYAEKIWRAAPVE
jgi:starch phosphorylase